MVSASFVLITVTFAAIWYFAPRRETSARAGPRRSEDRLHEDVKQHENDGAANQRADRAAASAAASPSEPAVAHWSTSTSARGAYGTAHRGARSSRIPKTMLKSPSHRGG